MPRKANALDATPSPITTKFARTGSGNGAFLPCAAFGETKGASHRKRGRAHQPELDACFG